MTREGVVFTVHDASFMEVAVHNANPLASLREAIKNAIEAKATEIHVFPEARTGRTIVYDNGHGMSAEELLTFMSAFGAGSKKRGKDDNLGIGLKAVAPVQNPSGVIITSWRNRRSAAQIILGRIDSGQYGVFKEGGELVRSVAVPTYEGEECPVSGTEVVLRDLDFQPYVFRKFLNDRLLRIPQGVNIRVFQRGGERGLEARPVIGLLEGMQRVCSRTGSVPMEHCTLHWGIRHENPDERARNFITNVFSAHSMYMAWNGESFQWWEFARGGRIKLNAWGIRSGSAQVMLVVEARGRHIAPSLDRCQITGWNDDAAREEVVENLPEELVRFMTEWEDKHFDPEFERGLVQGLLSEIGVPTSVVKPSQEGAMLPGRGLFDADEDDEREERGRRRHRTERRARSFKTRGRPGYAFVDQKELGNQPIAFDQNAHRILLNRDAFLVKIAEKAPTAKARTDVRAMMAAHVIAFFESFTHEYDEVPSDTDLINSLRSFSEVWGKLMVKHTTMVRLPRIPTKK